MDSEELGVEEEGGRLTIRGTPGRTLMPNPGAIHPGLGGGVMEDSSGVVGETPRGTPAQSGMGILGGPVEVVLVVGTMVVREEKNGGIMALVTVAMDLVDQTESGAIILPMNKKALQTLLLPLDASSTGQQFMQEEPRQRLKNGKVDVHVHVGEYSMCNKISFGEGEGGWGFVDYVLEMC